MAKKSIVIVLNGISLRKKYFYKTYVPALSKIANIEVKETLTKNDAVLLASKATDHYADAVIAAGGDGTLNQVLNGVITGRETATKLPVIGLIPLGSGNDFARTAGVQDDVSQIAALVQNFKPNKIDLGQIDYTNVQTNKTEIRYFVNMADIGMGPVVVEKVLKSGRSLGHAMAYYKSILSTFMTYKPIEVEAVTNGWTWKGKLRTLGVGNGKYYGSGLGITPDAQLNDRLFQVFICGNVSVFDFMRYTGHLKRGRHIRIPEVHYKTTTHVSLKSEKLCLIEGDGEILGKLPATVRLHERQFDFLI
ncbi:MAG TPA: diacylglycerol kinase family protein [Chryseosolibacter sp.]